MKLTNEIIMYSNLKEYINLFDNPIYLLDDFLQYRLVPPHIGVAVLNVVLSNVYIEGFNNISFIKVFNGNLEQGINPNILIIGKDLRTHMLEADLFHRFGIIPYNRKTVCPINGTSCKTYMEEAVHNIATLIYELI